MSHCGRIGLLVARATALMRVRAMTPFDLTSSMRGAMLLGTGAGVGESEVAAMTLEYGAAASVAAAEAVGEGRERGAVPIPAALELCRALFRKRLDSVPDKVAVHTSEHDEEAEGEESHVGAPDISTRDDPIVAAIHATFLLAAPASSTAEIGLVVHFMRMCKNVMKHHPGLLQSLDALLSGPAAALRPHIESSADEAWRAATQFMDLAAIAGAMDHERPTHVMRRVRLLQAVLEAQLVAGKLRGPALLRCVVGTSHLALRRDAAAVDRAMLRQQLQRLCDAAMVSSQSTSATRADQLLFISRHDAHPAVFLLRQLERPASAPLLSPRLVARYRGALQRCLLRSIGWHIGRSGAAKLPPATSGVLISLLRQLAIIVSPAESARVMTRALKLLAGPRDDWMWVRTLPDSDMYRLCSCVLSIGPSWRSRAFGAAVTQIAGQLADKLNVADQPHLRHTALVVGAAALSTAQDPELVPLRRVLSAAACEGLGVLCGSSSSAVPPERPSRPPSRENSHAAVVAVSRVIAMWGSGSGSDAQSDEMAVALRRALDDGSVPVRVAVQVLHELRWRRRIAEEFDPSLRAALVALVVARAGDVAEAATVAASGGRLFGLLVLAVAREVRAGVLSPEHVVHLMRAVVQKDSFDVLTVRFPLLVALSHRMTAIGTCRAVGLAVRGMLAAEARLAAQHFADVLHLALAISRDAGRCPSVASLSLKVVRALLVCLLREPVAAPGGCVLAFHSQHWVTLGAALRLAEHLDAAAAADDSEEKGVSRGAARGVIRALQRETIAAAEVFIQLVAAALRNGGPCELPPPPPPAPTEPAGASSGERDMEPLRISPQLKSAIERFVEAHGPKLSPAAVAGLLQVAGPTAAPAPADSAGKPVTLP